MILQVGNSTSIPHVTGRCQNTGAPKALYKITVGDVFKDIWGVTSARLRLGSHFLHISRAHVHVCVNTVKKIQRTSTLWNMFGLNRPDKGYVTRTGIHEVWWWLEENVLEFSNDFLLLAS